MAPFAEAILSESVKVGTPSSSVISSPARDKIIREFDDPYLEVVRLQKRKI
jgi:hypothetical protein